MCDTLTQQSIDYFIGREEYQLSYLHFEFKDLITVLEVFRKRPFTPPMYDWIFMYVLLAREHADWSGLGLEDRQDDSE